MDHPPGVGVGHRLGHADEDRQEPGMVARRVGPLGQDLGQGPAFDQLHGEVGATVGEGAQLVDRDDAGVLQLAADLGLLDEPADKLGLVAVRFQKHLHGEVSAEVGVVPLEDRPHSPAGDLAEEEHPGRARSLVGHLGRAGLDDRSRVGPGFGVAEQDPRDSAQGFGQGRQGAPMRGAEHDGQLMPTLQPDLDQTLRADPPRRIGGPRSSAPRAASLLVHRGDSTVMARNPTVLL